MKRNRELEPARNGRFITESAAIIDRYLMGDVPSSPGEGHVQFQRITGVVSMVVGCKAPCRVATSRYCPSPEELTIRFRPSGVWAIDGIPTLSRCFSVCPGEVGMVVGSDPGRAIGLLTRHSGRGWKCMPRMTARVWDKGRGGVG